MTEYFNRFSITMTKSQARSVSHSGQCDDDVQHLLTIPAIRRQLRKIPDADLIAELKGYGAWTDADLANRADNEARLIWITGCNITEQARL